MSKNYIIIFAVLVVIIILPSVSAVNTDVLDDVQSILDEITNTNEHIVNVEKYIESVDQTSDEMAESLKILEKRINDLSIEVENVLEDVDKYDGYINSLIMILSVGVIAIIIGILSLFGCTYFIVKKK